MRMTWRLVLPVLAIAALTGFLAIAAQTHEPVASAVVKIMPSIGHGSGVHIGDGLILTAAHVVSEGDVDVVTDDGVSRPATVLWSDLANDITLLRAKPDGIATADINCADLAVGQSLTAYGSPSDLDFISTSGRVAGASRSVADWKVVFPVDMTILPGMSGGPAVDASGRVAAINIGFLTIPLGFSTSATGMGVVVPSSVICELLVR